MDNGFIRPESEYMNCVVLSIELSYVWNKGPIAGVRSISSSVPILVLVLGLVLEPESSESESESESRVRSFYLRTLTP